MSYVVTRQIQWPEGIKMVEISKGGINYVNPDALSPIYDMEFEEINDPREAVDIAIEIKEAWKKRETKDKITIGVGCTGGFAMPFKPISIS